MRDIGLAVGRDGSPVGEDLADLAEADGERARHHGVLREGWIVEMRGHHLDPGRLGRFELRRDRPGIDARDQIDDVVLVADRKFDALDPLAGLPLVLPLRDLQSDLGAGRLLAIDDALQERIGAVVGDRHHLLAGRALLGVERLARRHELWCRRVLGQRFLGLGKAVGGVVGNCRARKKPNGGRRSYRREQ